MGRRTQAGLGGHQMPDRRRTAPDSFLQASWSLLPVLRHAQINRRLCIPAISHPKVLVASAIEQKKIYFLITTRHRSGTPFTESIFILITIEMKLTLHILYRYLYCFCFLFNSNLLHFFNFSNTDFPDVSYLFIFLFF